MTRQNKPIRGFVATKADEVIVLEASQVGPENYCVSTRGTRGGGDIGCRSWGMADKLLLEASKLLREKGWVLTAIRALE